MSFVLERDFLNIIDSTVLTGLQGTDGLALNNAIAAAVDEVKSYLRFRYDVDIYFNIEDYAAGLPYSQGSVVSQLDGQEIVYFTALEDHAAGTDLQDPALWAPGDPRSRKIITVVCVIALYDLYTRVAGTEIPGWLNLRYDGGDPTQRGGVIGYLKQIQKGTVQPDMPLRPTVADGTDDTGNKIITGAATDVINNQNSI